MHGHRPQVLAKAQHLIARIKHQPHKRGAVLQHAFSKPNQVLETVCTHRRTSLDFNTHRQPVGCFNDKVNFALLPVAVVGQGMCIVLGIELRGQLCKYKTFHQLV